MNLATYLESAIRQRAFLLGTGAASIRWCGSPARVMARQTVDTRATSPPCRSTGKRFLAWFQYGRIGSTTLCRHGPGHQPEA
jgi:hypothetical protein